MYKLESLSAAQAIIQQSESLIVSAEEKLTRLSSDSSQADQIELLRINTQLNIHTSKMIAPIYYAANNGGIPSRKAKTVEIFGWKVSRDAVPSILFRAVILILLLAIWNNLSGQNIQIGPNGLSISKESK